MKAKELQIGDYVNYRGQIIKVTSLYDKGGSNEVGWGIKEDTWVNAINVEPIPLTAEILEKNGFKEDKYCQMILDEELGSSEIYIVLQEGDECYWWTVSNELIAKIRYVHELQHVFRLCKIEKEIEL